MRRNFNFLISHGDTLRDEDELLVHYNDRYDMHKPAAMGNFLWQMGSNNHKDRTPGIDDILFFGCIQFRNIPELVDSVVLVLNNALFVLFD